jgi:hypothetical protein
MRRANSTKQLPADVCEETASRIRERDSSRAIRVTPCRLCLLDLDMVANNERQQPIISEG